MLPIQTGRLARDWLGCFLLFFIAFHWVTFSHEFLGHGLAAVLLGGRIDNFYLSLMGASGYVTTSLKTDSAVASAIFQWAGIYITLLMAGALYLFLRNRAVTHWVRFLGWICVVSLLSSAMGYTVLGLYSLYGDPRETALWLSERSLLGVSITIALLIHALLVFLWATQAWRLPLSGPGRGGEAFRIFWVVFILGTAAGTVGVLNLAETTLKSNMTMEMAVATQRHLKLWGQERRDLARRYGGSAKIPSREIKDAWKRTGARAKVDEPWRIEWVYYPVLFLAAVAGLMSRIIPPEPASPFFSSLHGPLWLSLLSIAVSALSIFWQQ